MTTLSNSTRPLQLALLVNDTPVVPVIESFGTYSDIYQRWLDESRPNKDIAFQLTSFDVVNHSEIYPDPDEYDAIILTGSSASAYSPLPWIERLKEYIKDVATNHPHVRIIGICFGHQIVASALGGTCVPNNGIWEIGVTDVLLTPTGKDVFGVENICIQQMHRDHVPTIPPAFILLGSTTVAPIQGMILPYPALEQGTVPTAAETHILTVQGHPEFTGPIVEKIVDVREERGIIDAERANKAREDAHRRHDGLGIVGQAIWKVLVNRVP